MIAHLDVCWTNTVGSAKPVSLFKFGCSLGDNSPHSGLIGLGHAHTGAQLCWLVNFKLYEFRPSKWRMLVFAFMNCVTNDSLWDAHIVAWIRYANDSKRTVTQLVAQTSLNILFKFLQQLFDFLPWMWARCLTTVNSHRKKISNKDKKVVLCLS